MSNQNSTQDLFTLAQKVGGNEVVRESLTQIISDRVHDDRLWSLLLEHSVIQSDIDTVLMLLQCDAPLHAADFLSLPKQCDTFPSIIAYRSGHVWDEQLSAEEMQGLMDGKSHESKQIARKSQAFVQKREGKAKMMVTRNHVQQLAVHLSAVLNLSKTLEEMVDKIRNTNQVHSEERELSKKKCSKYDFRCVTSIGQVPHEVLCTFVSPEFHWRQEVSRKNSQEYDYFYEGATGGHWELSITPLKMKRVKVGKIKFEKFSINRNFILPIQS